MDATGLQRLDTDWQGRSRREDHFAGADWAAAAVDTGRNNCAPFMAFITNPPDFAPGAGDDVTRREVAIFGWVPLAGELG